MLIALSQRAVPFLLDGRPVVFSDGSKTLFELNESAAAILARLDQPTPFDAFHGEIAAELPGGAPELDRLLIDWSRQGLLNVQSDPAASAAVTPCETRFLSCAGRCAELRFPGEELGPTVAAAYSHLPQSGAADLTAAVHAKGALAVITIGDRPAVICPLAAAGPAFRFELVGALLDDAQAIALHAACLVRDGQAVVLLGSPGAGKSTLSLLAARAGFVLAADDITLFDPLALAVSPLALPLTLKQGSWQIAEQAGVRIEHWPPAVRGDGVCVRYCPLPAPVPAGPLPVRAFVRLHRDTTARPRIVPASRIEILQTLCEEANAQREFASIESLHALVAAVEAAETLDLHYAEAGQGIALLEQYLGG